ncbi:MAG: TetR/AcrR family transcriptional regulator [Dehalococcoidia bacterium]
MATSMMSSAPVAGKPKRQGRSSRGGDRTRRRILSEALKLFSKNGFHGASVRDIARSVGLTEAALYYHFPSKQAIVKALYEERGFMAALDELEHLPGQLPLGAQLVANALASARLWHENADLLRVVITEVLRGDRAARGAHRELMDRWHRGIVDLLGRYQASGEIRDRIDVTDAATSWVNLMFGTFMDRLLDLGGSTRRSGFLTPKFQRRVEATALVFGDRLRKAN